MVPLIEFYMATGNGKGSAVQVKANGNSEVYFEMANQTPGTNQQTKSFDWKNKNWINDELFLREIRTILSSGIRNIAYYPDTYIDNKPSLERAKLEFSSKTLPQ